MDKTDKTGKTAAAKPTLTADEKRAKRNAYARSYYKEHREKLIEAVRRCQAKKKAAAKAAKAKAMKAVAPKKAEPAVAQVAEQKASVKAAKQA